MYEPSDREKNVFFVPSCLRGCISLKRLPDAEMEPPASLLLLAVDQQTLDGLSWH